MELHISRLQYWYPNCQSLTVEDASKISSTFHDWPKLEFVPSMQRRRLSPFAKIALFVANQTMSGLDESLPIVFSSRHGDLHKTSDLLTDLTNKTALSPTAFGLSVHNAIPSLYSILANNKQAINAISAKKDSFYMGLVDIYARLKSQIEKKVLLIHVDQHLPALYSEFSDESQISHAVSMIVSLPSGNNNPTTKSTNLTIQMQSKAATHQEQLPAALLFSQWFHSQQAELVYQSNEYQWNLSKNEPKN